MADNKLIATLIGATIFAGVLGAGVFGAPSVVSSDIGFAETSEPTNLPNVGVTNLQIESGLGTAAQFDGSNDSQVSTTQPADVDESWSVCSVATANQTAVTNNERRAVAGAGGGSVYYDGVDDEWTVYYYDVREQTSYEATIAAPSPTSQTLVCGSHNGTHLRIDRNTTMGTPVETVGAGTAESPASDNWHGVIDETRVHDQQLNTSQLQSYVNQPGQTVGIVPAARITYDVRTNTSGFLGFGGQTYSDSVDVFFLDAEANATGVTYVDGVSSPPISGGGVDYQLTNGNDTIELTGGELERGDVVYLTWDNESPFAQSLINLGLALGLLGLVAVPLLNRLE